MNKRHISYLAALLVFLSAPVLALSALTSDTQTGTTASPVQDTPQDANAGAGPVRVSLPWSKLTRSPGTKLFGVHNETSLEFTLRRDQMTTKADLHLSFTPSPALLPTVSHLRIYLNDELMHVVTIQAEQVGQRQSRDLPLDTRFLSTYNRIRIEFVGHYAQVCEDPAHSSLWVDVSTDTRVELTQQPLSMANELAFFPEPFLDINDMGMQQVAMVFPGSRSPAVLEAGAILASYFGAQAKWREVSFPVSYDALPDDHSVVFATNADRPDILRDYPAVDRPVVTMAGHPHNPSKKLLLILGKDDNDLKTAVTALALGGPVLRGQSVQIDTPPVLAHREPYDAPNWIPTDRPVRLSELVEYPGQLEVQGLRPNRIRVNLNLPPDLFVWRSNGIPLHLIYRYTPPMTRDDSRLVLTLNERFLASYRLPPHDERSSLARMRLQVAGNDITDVAKLVVPALRLGSQNQLGMDFSFASTVGNSDAGTCRTVLPVDTRASIDGDSVIDFTGYEHYIEMPNLRVFANSGFPFSRMADLADTVAVLPDDLDPVHLSTLFQTVALIGAQTGYPAYRMKVVQGWDSGIHNADILWIGETPDGLIDRQDVNLLLQHTSTTLRRALRAPGIEQAAMTPHRLDAPDPETAGTVDIRSVAPVAAIIGMESPFQAKRSMIGLLGSTPEDFRLLQEALRDPGKRDAIYGSLSIVRTSGVVSEVASSHYFVGELRWWQRLWFHLSDHPILLAAVAALCVLIVAAIVWMSLKWVARRRLQEHD